MWRDIREELDQVYGIRGDDVALQMVVVSVHLYMFNAKRILRLLVGGGGECKELEKGLCLILDGGRDLFSPQDD